MQKVSFKNSRNLTLIGSLWQAPSDAIIIMAHGSGSNRRARGLFEAIAPALQAERYNVLTFDFSGHGESDDDVFTLSQSVDDLRAAIAFAKAHKYKRIALFGHSLGAYSCLAAFTPDIITMVLLGALTGPVQWKWEDMCSQSQIEQMHKTGYILAEVNDGLRKNLKINGNLVHDLAQIDQKKLLSTITCPVLIIHGGSNQDQQEQDMLTVSKRALPLLPQGSELKIIPEAQHTFLDHINEVIKLTTQWYKKHFSVNK